MAAKKKPDYIPADPVKARTKLKKMVATMQPFYKELGFLDEEYSEWNTAVETLDADVDGAIDAELKAKAAKARRKTSYREAVRITRALIQRGQKHPKMTDERRAALEITIPDKVRTRGNSSEEEPPE